MGKGRGGGDDECAKEGGGRAKNRWKVGQKGSCSVSKSVGEAGDSGAERKSESMAM